MRLLGLMAADKEIRKATPAAPCLQIYAAYCTSWSIMDRLYFCIFALLCPTGFSAASEYKLCATVEYENLCKTIEASSNEITCVRVSDSVDCLLKMQKNEADFGTFHTEEAFLAARFLERPGMVLAEVRHRDRTNEPFGFETVAVIRKTLLGGMHALKDSHYCHPGFSKAQYWSDRVLKEFEKKVLEIFKDDIKCDSSLRSAYEDDLHRLSTIFSKACRPGTWAVNDWWDRKLKRDYHNLCEQCDDSRTCSYKFLNKGRHSNAIRCLTLHGGDVTYTALEFIKEYFELDSDEVVVGVPDYRDPSRYSFLCPDGSTLPLTATRPCAWIKQPWTSVIATNSTGIQLLQDLKSWLEVEGKASWTNHLRSILAKGDGVLKFRDTFVSVSEYIKEGRSIPGEVEESCRRAIKWCTIGSTEKKKCEYIATAALTHGLPVRLRCVGGNSKIDCLAKIRAREADVVYVDTELGFISRKVYNLTAAAYLETQRTGNYYGVLVTKGNAIKKINDLRGKRACFPQYNGLGWLTYVEALKSFSVIPRRSCPHSKEVWKHLSKICAPGAKDPALNPRFAKASDSLCKGCASALAGSSCEATSSNPYYGEIGALRCLNNEDGDVAFLDFHSIQKYFALDRRNTSDSSINPNDFKILCRDGSLEEFSAVNPNKCSFIQINGGEVVMRNDLDPIEETDIRQTLMELDDLFGTTSRSYNPVLKMFETFDGQSDVLFKESAVSLVSETQNRFVSNYLKLLSDSANCLDDNSSSAILPSVFVVGFSIFFIFYQG